MEESSLGELYKDIANNRPVESNVRRHRRLSYYTLCVTKPKSTKLNIIFSMCYHYYTILCCISIHLNAEFLNQILFNEDMKCYSNV